MCCICWCHYCYIVWRCECIYIGSTQRKLSKRRQSRDWLRGRGYAAVWVKNWWCGFLNVSLWYKLLGSVFEAPPPRKNYNKSRIWIEHFPHCPRSTKCCWIKVVWDGWSCNCINTFDSLKWNVQLLGEILVWCRVHQGSSDREYLKELLTRCKAPLFKTLKDTTGKWKGIITTAYGVRFSTWMTPSF